MAKSSLVLFDEFVGIFGHVIAARSGAEPLLQQFTDSISFRQVLKVLENRISLSGGVWPAGSRPGADSSTATLLLKRFEVNPVNQLAARRVRRPPRRAANPPRKTYVTPLSLLFPKQVLV